MSVRRMNVSYMSCKGGEGYCHPPVTRVLSSAMRTSRLAWFFALTVAAALGVAAPGGPAAARPASSRIDRLLAGMTMPEKVGQLFTTYAYGADAGAPSDVNRRLYGVDTPAQVVAKYHLGGVIYFAWTDSLQSPRQLAGLSNGLQEIGRAHV